MNSLAVAKPCSKLFARGLAEVILAILVSASAHAAIVADCTQSGLITAMSGGGVVTFGCSGNIPITNTIVVDRDVMLDASGQNVSVDGQGLVRIFEVNSGVTLSLINLALVNGRSKGTNSDIFGVGGDGMGGAVRNNAGTLNLLNCALRDNAAIGGTPKGRALGGAIYNSEGGVINAADCSFSWNASTGGNESTLGVAGGGAVFNQGGMFNAARCLFNSNVVVGGVGITGFGFGGSGANAFGGGVGSAGGILHLIDSKFLANRASGGAGGNSGDPRNPGPPGIAWGGAIYSTGSVMTAERTVFSTNSASRNGGAVYFAGLNGALTNCTLAGNVAIGPNDSLPGSFPRTGKPGAGGGVMAEGVLQVVGCTIVGNQALGGWAGSFGGSFANGGEGTGGGIHNLGMMVIMNSTIVSNLAFGGFAANNASLPRQGGRGAGGGIYSTGSISFSHVTVSGNTAKGGDPGGQSEGGGIWVAGTVSLAGANFLNSILAYNVGGNRFGPLNDAGHNICSDSSCGSGPGSFGNTDPKLDSLGDYGGPTLTMALLPGSPALDTGDSAQSLATDQRGVSRPVGTAPDIGAFESTDSLRSRIAGWNATGGTFILSFENTNANNFTVLASTNLAAPLVEWQVLGSPELLPNGSYRYVDIEAINHPRRFYRVRTP